MKIAVLVGSLRKESLNLKMAKALISIVGPEHEYQLVSLADLDMYNEDLDHENPPATWSRFRKAMNDAQAVLFVTPEYNRSMPGCLKNALDVGSRPYGKSVFNHKPAGIVTVSPGAAGGFGANHHLRQSLVILNMPTLQQPEAYIGQGGDLFNEAGDFKNDKTKAFLKSFVDAFSAWVSKIAA